MEKLGGLGGRWARWGELGEGLTQGRGEAERRVAVKG